MQKEQTPNGTVYRCAGRRGGEVVLLGSHFTFRGFLTRYRLQLPAGASGTLHGRFVEQGERRDGQRRPAPAPAPARDDGEIPSLDELAGMLAALDR